MARNKYPEETVEKILEVSYRLFLEKGYEHTTIQDIVDALGMSKGAVYHHFKSKEDILDKISNRYYDYVDWFRDIRSDPGLTGLEKLKAIMVQQLSDPRKLAVDNIAMALTANPQLLALSLNACMYEATPFCLEIIEEGTRDGSIQTQHPRQLAEVVMLLLNIWVGIYATDRADFEGKVRYLKEITDNLGLPLIDDALMDVALGYYDQVMSAR